MTEPLSDEQAKAQVAQAAREIVRAAGLREVTGGFLFESCNDQGAPPYRGKVELSFAIPTGIEPGDYFEQIAGAMVHQGWTPGPPRGLCPFGVVIHTGAVMAIICPAADARGSLQVCGECRNMTDHRHDGTTIGVEITEQLSGS